MMPDRIATRKSSIVASVVWKGHVKRIRVEPESRWFTLPLSACVSKGDTVRIQGGDAWVICKNGESKFLRPYFEWETIELGSLKLEIAVKEITEEEEYDAYKSLAEFHYRGHAIHGRTSRLILRTFHPAYPQVIGYIELATPFYMNKARAAVLNSPFVYNGVEWQKWDIETLRKYIHVVVRIARTVVYPEFRGLGVGQILIKHAVQFARDRWQVAGYLPLFLEISADMLKYVPFAERAGMIFVGETEGNLHRVAKDMDYLIRRFGSHRTGQTDFEETCGICDQQISRKDRVLELMEEQGLSQQEVIQKLNHLSRETVLKDFALFHGIVTLPKPHYMIGLRSAAVDFLQKRVKELAPKNGTVPPQIIVQPLKHPIILKDISISYVSKVRRTESTHAVQQAFGISPDDLHSDVIRRLTVSIEPGKVVLIVGPSGSGKTSLLYSISKTNKNSLNARIQGDIAIPDEAVLGTFRPIQSKKPLIEVLGAKNIRYGLYLLGLAGLSEAYLYLKRFGELSAGQQYRAMLAYLIAEEKNVWLADEFCANLDPVTANVVAHNIQLIARKIGATLIVAAPHCSYFVSSLRPDIVIRLTSAWEHAIIPGKEFCLAMTQRQHWNSNPPSLKLFPEFLSEVRKGNKTTTIRAGRKHFEKGLLLLQSDREIIAVRVIETNHKTFSELTKEDAKSEGFKSVSELKETLLYIYPKLKADSPITIIRFEPLCGEE